MTNSENATLPAETSFFKNGARISQKKLVSSWRSLFVPGLPSMPRENIETRQEAYEIALANRHKPWARRYLKSIGRQPWGM